MTLKHTEYCSEVHVCTHKNKSNSALRHSHFWKNSPVFSWECQTEAGNWKDASIHSSPIRTRKGFILEDRRSRTLHIQEQIPIIDLGRARLNLLSFRSYSGVHAFSAATKQTQKHFRIPNCSRSGRQQPESERGPFWNHVSMFLLGVFTLRSLAWGGRGPLWRCSFKVNNSVKLPSVYSDIRIQGCKTDYFKSRVLSALMSISCS